MKLKLSLLLLFIVSVVSAQKQPYVIYSANGKKVSYEKMIRSLSKQDVILFGELHNNPIAHWLQYEVTSDLAAERQLIMGAEMLEADDQLTLDKYLSNAINTKQLDTMARLWPNYKTDYAPLVDFARDKKIPFIATNIPRRYANAVYKGGFGVLDTLTAVEKTWIAPLPIAFDSELPTYRNILKMMGDHGTPELVMAQATKDATMAHFILKNYSTGKLFIHYNGAYHSNNYEGILWYLKRENGELSYTTISTVSQKNVNKLLEENKGLADFIICVDDNMTTTY